MSSVPTRKKRSISMPPDLDAAVADAAAAAGTSYSAWLASAARKELTLRAGLAAVAAYERDEGAFTPDELAEAEAWVLEVAERSDRVGRRIRRSA
jgi:hypothetical protein